MIKVLIADDSMLTRLVIKDLLARDSEIKVVAEVCDGRQAIDETCRLRPDLIIMDVMMPVLDGLEAIKEIMSSCPTPILVLSANVDQKDSRSAFNAIKHGALDVMEKPRGMVTEAFEEIAARLIDKVKFLSRVRVIHHFRRRHQVLAPMPAPLPKTEGPRSILAVGASTGGPKAVMRLLKELPLIDKTRVLVVQHIARGFAAGFADWLNRESAYRVRLAREGDTLEAGQALVAPNDVHMKVKEGRIELVETPPINSCRPSIDVLFKSLAGSGLGCETVGVLLTGMGRDGAVGMFALRESGSYNIAQDENSSAVFGMPRAAIELRAVHEVLPIQNIAAAVGRQLNQGK